MNDDYYIPNAFFAFQSDLYKSELRNHLAKAIIDSLRIKDRSAITPWKISIYHIEEFEIHLGEDKHKHLQRLKELYRWNEKTKNNTDMTFLSSGEMGLSRYNAQRILEKPDTKVIIEKAKENMLNYIMYGTYNDDSLTRVKYTDDSKVLNTLQDIISRLINIKSKNKIIEIKDCFYAYTYKGEIRFFQ